MICPVCDLNFREALPSGMLLICPGCGTRRLTGLGAEVEMRRPAADLELRDEALRPPNLRDLAEELGIERPDLGTLAEASRDLARLSLQGERYTRDADFRDAVDDVLALIKGMYPLIKGMGR